MVSEKAREREGITLTQPLATGLAAARLAELKPARAHRYQHDRPMQGFCVVSCGPGFCRVTLHVENGQTLTDRSGAGGFYYEGWLVGPAGAVSLGAFNVGPDGHGCATRVVASSVVQPGRAERVRVTVEPFGGSHSGAIAVLEGRLIWLEEPAQAAAPPVSESTATAASSPPASSWAGFPPPAESPAVPGASAHGPWAPDGREAREDSPAALEVGSSPGSASGQSQGAGEPTPADPARETGSEGFVRSAGLTANAALSGSGAGSARFGGPAGSGPHPAPFASTAAGLTDSAAAVAPVGGAIPGAGSTPLADPYAPAPNGGAPAAEADSGAAPAPADARTEAAAVAVTTGFAPVGLATQTSADAADRGAESGGATPALAAERDVAGAEPDTSSAIATAGAATQSDTLPAGFTSPAVPPGAVGGLPPTPGTPAGTQAAAPPTPTGDAGDTAENAAPAGDAQQSAPRVRSANPLEIQVSLVQRHPMTPRASGLATLNLRRGSLTLSLRGLPSPMALGRDRTTGRPFNAYRVWLVNQRSQVRTPVGYCERAWGENFRFQADGLPLNRNDTILITVEDRSAAAPATHAAPHVLIGSYQP